MSHADVVSFSPDSKNCARVSVQLPEALVEIKDYSFYLLIHNSNNHIHKLAKNTKLGSIHYQSSTEGCHPQYHTTQKEEQRGSPGVSESRQWRKSSNVVSESTGDVRRLAKVSYFSGEYPEMC